MKIEYASEAELRAELRRRCKGWGGQRRFARLAQCSPPFLSRMLKGKKALQGAVLKELGYKAVTVYVKIKKRETP